MTNTPRIITSVLLWATTTLGLVVAKYDQACSMFYIIQTPENELTFLENEWIMGQDRCINDMRARGKDHFEFITELEDSLAESISLANLSVRAAGQRKHNFFPISLQPWRDMPTQDASISESQKTELLDELQACFGREFKRGTEEWLDLQFVYAYSYPSLVSQYLYEIEKVDYATPQMIIESTFTAIRRNHHLALLRVAYSRRQDGSCTKIDHYRLKELLTREANVFDQALFGEIYGTIPHEAPLLPTLASNLGTYLVYDQVRAPPIANVDESMLVPVAMGKNHVVNFLMREHDGGKRRRAQRVRVPSPLASFSINASDLEKDKKPPTEPSLRGRSSTRRRSGSSRSRSSRSESPSKDSRGKRGSPSPPRTSSRRSRSRSLERESAFV